MPTPNPLEKHIETLRAAGYKITKARLTVLQAIEDLGGHVTSTEILHAVYQADSSIGRASVFRTLDMLTRLCIVRPTFVDGHHGPSYVLMPEGHHHHIVCTHCHRVYEFDECNLDDIADTLADKFNMELTGHLVEVYGLCAECRNQPSAESN